MDSSLRIVPASTPKTATIQDTANSLGLHDTLKHGPRSLASEVKTVSTIKDRLENWEATQDNLKLNLHRNVYGMHAPIRLLMERKLVGHNPHMPALRTSNVHLDILMGRDETLEPADFMMPASEMSASMDIHADMEKKLRM
ncbi:proteasome maturation factor UMP1 [Irpex rosettiformis]|uniref:Proteasome maturation factor UMP1 n=1 Tax=Irpex rosettiformis TaxID=378272 RepID=A0ACB8U656_9APHY|nr:proteasome maturation factor UMP1 [Irpex rosettiformis]